MDLYDTEEKRPSRPPQVPLAGKKRRSEFVGKGCMIQALGLLALFVLPQLLGFAVGIMVGAAVAVALLVVGGRMATSWECGACGNRLTSERVTLCPVCRSYVGEGDP